MPFDSPSNQNPRLIAMTRAEARALRNAVTRVLYALRMLGQARLAQHAVGGVSTNDADGHVNLGGSVLTPVDRVAFCAPRVDIPLRGGAYTVLMTRCFDWPIGFSCNSASKRCGAVDRYELIELALLGANLGGGGDDLISKRVSRRSKANQTVHEPKYRMAPKSRSLIKIVLCNQSILFVWFPL